MAQMAFLKPAVADRETTGATYGTAMPRTCSCNLHMQQPRQPDTCLAPDGYPKPLGSVSALYRLLRLQGYFLVLQTPQTNPYADLAPDDAVLGALALGLRLVDVREPLAQVELRLRLALHAANADQRGMLVLVAQPPARAGGAKFLFAEVWACGVGEKRCALSTGAVRRAGR